MIPGILKPEYMMLVNPLTAQLNISIIVPGILEDTSVINTCFRKVIAKITKLTLIRLIIPPSRWEMVKETGAQIPLIYGMTRCL